ncbi:glyoxalase superfamily protein [Defluviimonas salinarum]|uniref:Glyoxalase superfamily protein n=1 Tax=Defluviimonas salinarum TaxID=2992147 RepID=A0ABT3JAI2_9RHOB|nr:glyoxalase superfamily protein [Defluviimonas salinarum]MCW3784707.1 glyoxalase superfamily protein [Defluviimonas salinarum]
MTDQSIGLPATPDIAKAQAKRLRSALAPDLTIGHSQSLELIARVHGEQSWGRLNSLISAATSIQLARDTEPKSPVAAYKQLPPNHVEQRVLQALWKGLDRAKDTHPSAKTISKSKEWLKQEIISPIALEEYLDTLDTNLGGMVFDMGAENLVKISEVETVSKYQRPKARDTSAWATTGLRPASFAAALIWLERLGFDTHPETFYGPLMEAIKKSKYVSQDELTCLWHSREKKERFQTAEYFVDAETAISNVDGQTVDGRNGLKINVARSTDQLGLIASLRVYR